MKKQHAVQVFNAAITAVQPSSLLKQHLAINEGSLTISGQYLPEHADHHIYVIGAGKAAAAMAVATQKILGDRLTAGLVVTKYDHALPVTGIKIREGAHPVPDQHCVEAVAETLQLLERVTKDDVVICLISGGASALWCDLPPGLSLPDVQATFNQLIRSGANIQEINTVRKHLSAIKGGQLVRHCNGAKIFSLIISDVPGDDLDAIASGPTVGDLSTFRDAQAILEKYALLSSLPKSIVTYIRKGMEGGIVETPKPGDPLFSNTVNKVIGSNQVALRAAAKKATDLGYHTYVIPSLVTGDAEVEARKLVCLAHEHKGNKPVCILQGGETTVKVTGEGKGGRNQHFALAALQELSKEQYTRTLDDIIVLSGGTDGTDGPTDAAGAVIDKETLARAANLQLDIAQYLKEQDAYHFLQQTNSLLITGPTQTNVMDIMMAIVP
jgi:glycerate 2-kinase